MKVVITGATGMVGQGVLKECLESQEVSEVVTITRLPLDETSPRIRQIIIPNFDEIDSNTEFLSLTDIDACFYCIGVSAAGLSEQEYHSLSFDLTLKIAKSLHGQNSKMTFTYLSAAGADSSEKGRIMWARVKGKTENALQNMGFSNVYSFRPGIIQPLDGIQSKTRSYRILYKLMSPFFPLLKMFAPNSFVTTRQIGKAMINVTNARYDQKTLEVKDILKISRA